MTIKLLSSFIILFPSGHKKYYGYFIENKTCFKIIFLLERRQSFLCNVSSFAWPSNMNLMLSEPSSFALGLRMRNKTAEVQEYHFPISSEIRKNSVHEIFRILLKYVKLSCCISLWGFIGVNCFPFCCIDRN